MFTHISHRTRFHTHLPRTYTHAYTLADSRIHTRRLTHTHSQTHAYTLADSHRHMVVTQKSCVLYSRTSFAEDVTAIIHNFIILLNRQIRQPTLCNTHPCDSNSTTSHSNKTNNIINTPILHYFHETILYIMNTYYTQTNLLVILTSTPIHI